MLIIFNGCSVVEEMEDQASIDQAITKFNEMCNSQRGEDLFICGNNVKDIIEPEYEEFEADNFTTSKGTNDILEYVNFTLDRFNYKKYEYATDYEAFGKEDFYTYLFEKEDEATKGDCEDYAITFIEDSIQYDFKEKMELIFGRVDGVYHSWVILYKDDKSYIFDTFNYYGIERSIAHKKREYKGLKVLYTKEYST